MLAKATVNMKDYASHIPTQKELRLNLKPLTKKCVSASLLLTLSCVFIKEGKATYVDWLVFAISCFYRLIKLTLLPARFSGTHLMQRCRGSWVVILSDFGPAARHLIPISGWCTNLCPYGRLMTTVCGCISRTSCETLWLWNCVSAYCNVNFYLDLLFRRLQGVQSDWLLV